MRDQLRGIWLLVSTTFRTDLWRSIGVLLEPIGQLGYPLAGLFLALITDGVLQHRSGLIVTGAVGIVACVLAKWGTGLMGNMIRVTLAERVGFAFDREIARLTSELPGLDHHERADYQDRLELLWQSQGALGGSMSRLIFTAGNVLTALGFVVILVLMSPYLLVLLIFVLPTIPAAAASERWNKAAEEESATPSRQARHLRQLAYGRDAGMEIRVFGLQDEIRSRAGAAWRRARLPLHLARSRADRTNAVLEIVYALALTAAIGFVLWQATQGRSTPGDVVMAVYTCQRVQQVVWTIRSVASIGDLLRGAARMRWLRDYAASPEARRPGDRPAPSRLADGIAFEDVSFHYPGTERPVLTDVSLRIPSGAVVAVVGENGAGKTTLVKLLTRMYEPSSGRILVDGTDLAALDITSWRSRLSAAFQDFVKLELIAQHAVGVGDLPRLDDHQATQAALARAAAADVVPTLPDGLSTQLGAAWEDGVDLSTGQWQKLALGRALMRDNPLVVFFDEPTASLDAPTEHALFERYAAEARAGSERGTITVLVSHRFSTVRSADLIVVLDDGHITEQGSHEQLLANQGLYAELYTMQARSYT